MKMYHKDAKESISVHPDRVEEMKRRGWTEKKPTKATAKPKAMDIEVTENGNS